MFVVKNKNIFFIGSGILVFLSLAVIMFWGLNFGIDFTGGSILEVTYPNGAPDVEEVKKQVEMIDFKSAPSVRPSGENGFIIRTNFLEEDERATLVETLSFSGSAEVVEDRFSSIGPSIGGELRSKAILAISIVVLTIILFVAFAFRRVSKPISSWKYGIVAIIALFHDVIITTGIFAVLGHFGGAEVDVLFVTALLTILGYSVNDTIVVFDRIRENLSKRLPADTPEEFAETVGISLEETYARSINTSLTTLLVLLSLLFFGGSTTTFFALALIIGVVAGTYSSIFLASPLLIKLNTAGRK
jgi:preprotein translocase subunit SecF